MGVTAGPGVGDGMAGCCVGVVPWTDSTIALNRAVFSSSLSWVGAGVAVGVAPWTDSTIALNRAVFSSSLSGVGVGVAI